MNLKAWVLVLFVLAVAIQIQQYLVYGHLWDDGQIHHETLSLLSFGVGVGLLVSNRIRSRKE